MRVPPKILLLVTVLGTVCATGCGRHSDAEESGNPSAGSQEAAVRAGLVALRTFDDSIRAQGQWRSSGEVLVAAPFAGTVDSMAVRAGDRVSKEEILCWLVTRESRAALHGAELLVQQARDEAGRAEGARALDLARRQLVRVPLTASRGGLVVRRSTEAGAEVAESGEILAIVPADAVVFEARVPASETSGIRPGQRARVQDEGGAVRWATVRQTLPVANPADQTTPVWLAANSGETPPVLDRFATATFYLGAPRRVLAVPDSAVVEDDLTGQTRVAVIDEAGRAIWRPVTLGTAAAGWHELKAPPLRAGTRVVIAGQRGLPDSTRVKTVP